MQREGDAFFPKKNDFESTENCEYVPFFFHELPMTLSTVPFLALIVHEIDAFSDEPEEMLLKGSSTFAGLFTTQFKIICCSLSRISFVEKTENWASFGMK